MRKLGIRLLRAGLVGALLPTVVAAEDTWNSGQCVKSGFIDRAADPNADLPVGPWTYNPSHEWSPVDTPATAVGLCPWGNRWRTNDCRVVSAHD